MPQFNPGAGLTKTNGSDDPHRRKFGRLGQEFLACQFGPIVNLSAGGMCVLCRRAPAGVVELELYGLQQPVRVRAKVAWSKRRGLFKKEVGFKFVDVSEELAKTLTAVATTARIKRVL